MARGWHTSEGFYFFQALLPAMVTGSDVMYTRERLQRPMADGRWMPAESLGLGVGSRRYHCVGGRRLRRWKRLERGSGLAGLAGLRARPGAER